MLQSTTVPQYEDHSPSSRAPAFRLVDDLYARSIVAELADEKLAQAERAGRVLLQVSEWLKSRAVMQRLTQVELSVRTGLSQSTIFRVLHSGNSKVTTLVQVAEALGYTIRIEFDVIP